MPSELLNPKKSWIGQADFKDEVRKLGGLFAQNFKKYADEATTEVIKAGRLDFLAAKVILWLTKTSGPDLESESKPDAVVPRANGESEVEPTTTAPSEVRGEGTFDSKAETDANKVPAEGTITNGDSVEKRTDEDSAGKASATNGGSAAQRKDTNGDSTEQAKANGSIEAERQVQPVIETEIKPNGDSAEEVNVNGGIEAQHQAQPDAEIGVKSQIENEIGKKAKVGGEVEGKPKIDI